MNNSAVPVKMIGLVTGGETHAEYLMCWDLKQNMATAEGRLWVYLICNQKMYFLKISSLAH